jgi:hypothetical protein
VAGKLPPSSSFLTLSSPFAAGATKGAGFSKTKMQGKKGEGKRLACVTVKGLWNLVRQTFFGLLSRGFICEIDLGSCFWADFHDYFSGFSLSFLLFSPASSAVLLDFLTLIATSRLVLILAIRSCLLCLFCLGFIQRTWRFPSRVLANPNLSVPRSAPARKTEEKSFLTYPNKTSEREGARRRE